jgi:L-ribulose-5-phosphate 3-epimerase
MLLKSISYWAFPNGLEGAADIERVMRDAKAAGYNAVELCIAEGGQLGLDADQGRCEAILRLADSIGIRVASIASGIYWSYSLASPDAADRAKAAEALTAMIRITAWLRSRTLLTIPGAVDVFFLPDFPTQSYDLVWKRVAEGLRAVLPAAEKAGVVLGIENVWNKFLLSPTEMASFIDGFASPAIGAYVDVGNILPYGYPEQWLRILGKRVAGVHLKDYRTSVGTASGFVDLLEGDVNWPAVMAAIAEIGYDGALVAEMIPLYRHYPEVRIANTSRAMDAILGRS